MWFYIFRYLISQSFCYVLTCLDTRRQEWHQRGTWCYITLVLSCFPCLLSQNRTFLPRFCRWSHPLLYPGSLFSKPDKNLYADPRFSLQSVYIPQMHTQDLQSPHWVYVMLSFITCWNHKRCLLWDICPHGGKCQWDFMEKRKGLLWTSWSIQSSHTPGIRKNKINKLSAQFLLCVIYKKKHNQTLIFFRTGWA